MIASRRVRWLSVAAGGAHEMRTAGALTIRWLFWIAPAIMVRRELKTSSVGGSS